MQDASLERRLSLLFNAESAQVRLPVNTWPALFPKLGEQDAPSMMRRLTDWVPFRSWGNRLPRRYVAPLATVAFALIAALLFVMLVNNDSDDGEGPSPAGSPTVPSGSTEPRPTADLEATTQKAFDDATATAMAGLEPDVTPIPAGTVTPIASPRPSSTPPVMQVVPLTSIGAPAAGTVYEELLARLPDNAATRSYARLTDVAGVLGVFGVERPAPGATEAEMGAFIEEWSAVSRQTGFGLPAPRWPYELGDYISTLDWYPYVAFDQWSVDQFATAANGFGNPSAPGIGPSFGYDVAFGHFDPDATAAALLVCGCDQPDMRQYAGVEFMTWGGEDGIGDLRRRLSPPLYDHIGRGPRLLLRDGEAYWAVRDSVMEGLIDTLNGTQPSLADDAGYAVAVRWLAALGTMSEITLAASGMSADEIVENNPPEGGGAVFDTPLMKRFDVAAVGSGWDGEQRFFGIVIGHADEAAALANRLIFEKRLRDQRRSGVSDTRWSDDVVRAEIGVEGRFLVARVYSTNPNWRVLSLSLGNTLLVHE